MYKNYMYSILRNYNLFNSYNVCLKLNWLPSSYLSKIVVEHSCPCLQNVCKQKKLFHQHNSTFSAIKIPAPL